jgi:hypothetical protein
MSVVKVCYVCKKPNGPRGAELRPYGYGAQPICFDCAMGDPEREGTAKAHFAVRLDHALRQGDGIAFIGDGCEDGPTANPRQR